MPNCDFYGTIEDHKKILDFIFTENTCDVYELESDFEKPLMKFESPEEVLNQFSRCYIDGKKWYTVCLQLYVKNSGPDFKPKRIALDPKRCGGSTYKYSAEGWGLVQLYLSTISDNQLINSHTNHNSLKRAYKWLEVTNDLGDPSDWDFELITKFSAKLNRQIRKLKVAKLDSRVVLPGGVKAWDSGYPLNPYSPEKYKIERLT